MVCTSTDMNICLYPELSRIGKEEEQGSHPMQSLKPCGLSRADEVSANLRQDGSTVAGFILVRQLQQLCVGLQRHLQANTSRHSTLHPADQHG